MPKVKISEYSATANSNTDVASINIDEGCAPSGINNAIRAVMGHLKDFQQGTYGDPFNGPVNGTVGATTPASGAFTTLSATGNVTLGDASTDTLNVGNGGLIKDSSGNLGLGVTPSGWSLGRALQVGTNGDASLLGFSNSSYLTSNAYFAGGWLYRTAASSGMYQMAGNVHSWHISTGTNTIDTSTLFSQAMTLDASGNLGVGATALSASYRLTTDGGRVSFTGNSDGLNLYMRYSSATAGAFIGSPAANAFAIADSNGTQRMYLDASGNLGLGVTPSLSTSNYRTLQIGNSATYRFSIFGQRVAGNAETFVGWNAYGGSNTTTVGTGYYYINTGDASTLYTQTDNHRWWTAPSGTAGNAISFTQAMTITNSGLLLQGATSSTFGMPTIGGASFKASNTGGGSPIVEIGNTDTTTDSDGSPALMVFKNSTTTGTNARFIQFSANGTGTTMGAIVGVSSGLCAFASFSDISLKKNIQPLFGSLAKIIALKPSSYDMIADNSHVNAGLIAQDVQQVYPEYVVENMSDKGKPILMGITGGLSGGFIAELICAIQEQQALITQLTARITALEGA